MKRRSIARVTWLGAAVVLVIAVDDISRPGWTTIQASQIETRRFSPRVLPRIAMFQEDSLDNAATYIVAHDPFRLERKPALVAYSVTQPGAALPPVVQQPAIQIALHGTIGGPPWRAIISGVPGHDGTIVVAPGDTLGGVTIKNVTRDGVTVRVRDSSWTVNLSGS